MAWIIIVILAVVAGAVLALYVSRSGGADVSKEEFVKWMEHKSDLCILDVRTAGEYASGHIPGAINIGHKEISAHLDKLAAYKDKNIVVYCERGGRAAMAQSDLTKAGFPNVYHLTGDMTAWRDAGRPTDSTGTKSGK